MNLMESSKQTSSLRLLLGLWNAPYMMGWYYAKELKKLTHIKTVGPSFSGTKSDFYLDANDPIQPIIDKLCPKIDFYVQFYSKPDIFPSDLHLLSIPKAWYVYDTHIHLDQIAQASYLFDIIFCPSEEDKVRLKSLGIPNVEVLEFAADPDTYYREIKSSDEFECALGFSGSARGHKQLEGREKFLNDLSASYDLRIEHRSLIGPNVADFYQDSKIVLNHAIGGELNMRVPEALLSGRPLLTPEVEGLNRYIDTQKSLITYNSSNANEKIDYMLSHPEEILEIAKHGQKEVLTRHTYAHRAAFMLDSLQKELDYIQKHGRRPKNPFLARASQLSYENFRAPGHALNNLCKDLAKQPRRNSDKILWIALRAVLLIFRFISFFLGKKLFGEK